MKISKLSFAGIVLLLILASIGVVSACSCTPGFWKAPKHWYAWPEDMQPDDLLTVGTMSNFDLNGDGVDDKYLDALKYKGGNDIQGAQRIFLRAWVAGKLNQAYEGWAFSDNSAMNILSDDRDSIIFSAGEQDWENNLGPCDVLEQLK
jgi:hypothetical protein